ncbi:MAG: hypothetical protein MJZ19_10155 [Paludibacteraceae bacterium]|nr:hypothetical protein [Paludibacteraceae bacterium]
MEGTTILCLIISVIVAIFLWSMMGRTSSNEGSPIDVDSKNNDDFQKKDCSQSVAENIADSDEVEEIPQGVKFNNLEVADYPKDFKEVVELSDVVAYFKGLLGKIKQGEDTPFIAKATAVLKFVQGLEIANPDSSLLLATYNERTESVENILILEYKGLGETLVKAFSNSKNGIVTLS